jgi:hypothetical protein
MKNSTAALTSGQPWQSINHTDAPTTMERSILLLLVIIIQAIYDVLEGTALLIDSLITITEDLTFQPITCQMLRSYGAKGRTKAQLIASLA